MGIVDELAPFAERLRSNLGEQRVDGERIQRLVLGLSSFDGQVVQIVGHPKRDLSHDITTASLVTSSYGRDARPTMASYRYSPVRAKRRSAAVLSTLGTRGIVG